jgi:hypothetical protein
MTTIAEQTTLDRELGFDPPGMSVDVRAIDARLWELISGFTYRTASGTDDELEIAAGEKTDFASVPRVFVWFIPAYGRYTKAAILHDHLCELAKEGKFSRREADKIFRQAMRLLGVAFLRRWLMWVAVRWGALAARGVRSEWIKDASFVVPISVAVSWILLPPAAVIAAALLVWYLVEVVAWVPLEISCRIRTRRGSAVKKVNKPTLTFKL